MTFLLLIFESITLTELGGILVFIVAAFWAWKSGIPQQLSNTTNALLEKRTTERDDALREKDQALKDADQLEEEVRLLRREIIQRVDISLQDQQTIKDLRHQQIKHLQD